MVLRGLNCAPKRGSQARGARADEKSARTCYPPLMAIRNRLENYVVRSTTELLGDLPEDRQSELGDLLGQMEGRGESFVEAERVRAAEREGQLREELESLEQRSTAEPQGTWFGAQVQNNPRPLSA